MRSFVLLSAMLAIAAGGQPGPNKFAPAIPLIQKMFFGTFEDQKTFRCDIAGCKWDEATVHADWMFYGAGLGNLAASSPIACALSCALDVNCGSFEYDWSPKGVNYCSWWKVGKCNTPITDPTQKSFNTCAKVDYVAPAADAARMDAFQELGPEMLESLIESRSN